MNRYDIHTAPATREARCLECQRFHRNGASCAPATTTARDSRPSWEPRPYSEGQAKLIKTMCEERGITAAQLLAVFPKRPTTFADGSKVIEWVKAQGFPQATPTSPTAQEAGEAIATRRDKNGKPQPSYYAIDIDGTLKFYRVKAGRKPGFYFIEVQASDDLHPIRNAAVKADIIAAIRAQGPAQAMARYGQELGSCGHCHRTLTDETSRALGIGPVCREG